MQHLAVELPIVYDTHRFSFGYVSAGPHDPLRGDEISSRALAILPSLFQICGTTFIDGSISPRHMVVVAFLFEDDQVAASDPAYCGAIDSICMGRCLRPENHHVVAASRDPPISVRLRRSMYPDSEISLARSDDGHGFPRVSMSNPPLRPAAGARGHRDRRSPQKGVSQICMPLLSCIRATPGPFISEVVGVERLDSKNS